MQGLWWQPTASSQKAQPSALAQSLADAEGGGGLLALAAAQRMNTETRRAVFCIVMGSQDAVDASERLLRLPLKVACYHTHQVLHCHGEGGFYGCLGTPGLRLLKAASIHRDWDTCD